MTIPQDPVVPLAARHKRGAGYRNGNRGRSKSRRGSSAPPIEDWDLETEQNGMVNNFITNEEEEKREYPSDSSQCHLWHDTLYERWKVRQRKRQRVFFRQ